MFFTSLVVLANFIFLPSSVLIDNITHFEPTPTQSNHVYFIRHGESLYNVPNADGIMKASGKGLSVPLTDEGRKQATTLGRKLVENLSGNEQFVIVSSSAARAKETANRIYTELSPFHDIEQGEGYDGFCELSLGKWEGQLKDAPYKHALEPWEKLSAKEKYAFPKVDTGESFYEVGQRALEDLQKVVHSYPDKTIIVVTHGNAMNALALAWHPELELSEEPGSALPNEFFGNCDVLLVEISEANNIDQAQIKMYVKSNK